MITLKFKTPVEVLVAACGLLIGGAGLGSAATLLLLRPAPPIRITTGANQAPTEAQPRPAQITPDAQVAVDPPPKPAARTATPAPAATPVKPAVVAKKSPLPTGNAQLPTQESATPRLATPAVQADTQTLPIPQPAPEQHVTMAAAGIVALDPASVRFGSGRIVTVGSTFPSGERLLSVDATRGRIVTDKRVLVVSASLQPAE